MDVAAALGSAWAARAAHTPPGDAHFPFDDVDRVDTGVLVVVTADDPRVLLELRPLTLRHHGGEYSFPGGRPEPTDTDLLATALRETHEELGIAPDALQVLGGLTTMPVLTSPHRLHPFLAVAAPCTTLRPDPAEVTEVLAAPLAGFFDGTYRREVFRYRHPDGATGDATIWRLPHGPLFGASAHVLDELLVLWGDVTGWALPDAKETDDEPWLAAAAERPVARQTGETNDGLGQR